MSRALMAGLIAEFIGVFALMFVGGAAIIHGGDLLTVALAHGLILGVCVTAAMQISGGQFNPAVSIALAAIGKQPIPKAVLFIIAQLAGGIVAAIALTRLMHGDAAEVKMVGATLGSYTMGEQPEVMAAFVLEMIATFFLMFVIIGTAVDSRGVAKHGAVAGLAIGLTVAADILAIGPLTGASMNPARSIGPVVAGSMIGVEGVAQHLWLYLVAPTIGALVCAGMWKAFVEEKALGIRD